MQIASERNSITHSDEITYADGNGPVSVGRDCLSKLADQWQGVTVGTSILIPKQAIHWWE